jgi:hypothetical protein
MTKKMQSKARPLQPPALIALRRAAKKAVELARRTHTPAYVLENGKVVDIARRTAKTTKKNRRERRR